MGWWLIVRLTVNLFSLWLTEILEINYHYHCFKKKLKINFHCFKKLKIHFEVLGIFRDGKIIIIISIILRIVE